MRLMLMGTAGGIHQSEAKRGIGYSLSWKRTRGAANSKTVRKRNLISTGDYRFIKRAIRVSRIDVVKPKLEMRKTNVLVKSNTSCLAFP